ncbi:MAG: hypothetical protein ACP5QT_08285 [Brevinematia bacterium]
MLHIFTALYPEARPLIDFYNLKKDLSITDFQQFRGEEIKLSITGVGGLRSASILSYVLAKEKTTCLLIGVCGAKNKKYGIGELFLINKAIQNETKKVFYPDILFDHKIKENSIESFNRVVENIAIDSEAELIDMESAYFLEAGQIFLPPHKVFILKIISDYLEISHITKEFISSLIEKNISEIDNIIKILMGFPLEMQDTILSEKEHYILEKISTNLSLTLYMKNELFKSYKIAKMKEKISIEKLIPFTARISKSKAERKIIYEEIKKLL